MKFELLSWKTLRALALHQSELICSEEGLTPKTSSILSFHGDNSTYINLFNY